MRKFLKLFVCISAIVFVLGGCQSKKAQELYQKAMKEIEVMKDLDATIQLNITSQAQEDTKASINLKMKRLQNGTAKISMPMEFTQGKEVSSATIYTDGVYDYIDFLGLKIKYKKKENKVLKNNTKSPVTIGVPVEYMESIALKKKDGMQQISYSTKDESVKLLVKELSDQLKVFSYKELSNVQTILAKGKITLDREGKVKQHNIQFEMKAKDQEEERVLVMEYDITFHDLENPFVLELPDFKDYVELTNANGQD